MKALLRTRRTNPTVAVIRMNQPSESTKRFFEATNEAIEMINSDPESVRETYFEWFSRVLAKLPPRIRAEGFRMRRRISVSRWNRWQPYSSRDFGKAYTWMLERKLVRPGVRYTEVVFPRLSRVFPR